MKYIEIVTQNVLEIRGNFGQSPGTLKLMICESGNDELCRALVLKKFACNECTCTSMGFENLAVKPTEENMAPKFLHTFASVMFARRQETYIDTPTMYSQIYRD